MNVLRGRKQYMLWGVSLHALRSALPPLPRGNVVNILNGAARDLRIPLHLYGRQG